MKTSKRSKVERRQNRRRKNRGRQTQAGEEKVKEGKTSDVMSRSEMPPSLSHISTILITLRNASE